MSINEKNVPNLFLRPEEKLISLEEVPTHSPQQPLTSLQALQLLADADKPENIGTKGPLVASRAFPGRAQRGHQALFEALFGRDSLLCSFFLLRSFPALALTTLTKLAELQGVTHNNTNEEEPGKIIHEHRMPDDPIAQMLTAKHGWAWPYYGSIDSTPLFIKVLADYVRLHGPDILWKQYTDRAGHTRAMYEALMQAAAWVQQRTTKNTEGLIESLSLHQAGSHHNNQGWKDSPDSYHHADGTLANQTQGIASIEVQAYAYDALYDASELMQDIMENDQLALETKKRLRSLSIDFVKRADQLRSIIMERFWIEDNQSGYFALGSDRDEQGNLRILQVKSSNMGHLLNSRLLDNTDSETLQRKQALVTALWAPGMLHYNGIRTLSAQENRFRPNSYHNGSVWPWDTYMIALGLERQKYTEQAQNLYKRIISTIQETQCFPEFVSGDSAAASTLSHRLVRVFDTKYKFENTIEQPPQEIQAWTVAAAVAIEYNPTP